MKNYFKELLIITGCIFVFSVITPFLNVNAD